MKLGARHREPPLGVRHFASLSLAGLAVPDAHDWSAAYPADGDALGNGTVGDCVQCAIYRAIQLRRAIVWGEKLALDAAETVALYAEMTGFDPVTGSNDNGTDTADAMSWWATRGVPVRGVEDVVLWTALGAQNVAHLKAALFALGPVQATVALPIGAQDVATWAGAPGTGADWGAGSWGGHRVLLVAYDAEGLTVRTWGQDARMSWPFWSAYALGADATYSPGWLDTAGRSPVGLDMAGTLAELRELGG